MNSVGKRLSRAGGGAPRGPPAPDPNATEDVEQANPPDVRTRLAVPLVHRPRRGPALDPANQALRDRALSPRMPAQVGCKDDCLHACQGAGCGGAGPGKTDHYREVAQRNVNPPPKRGARVEAELALASSRMRHPDAAPSRRLRRRYHQRSAEAEEHAAEVGEPGITSKSRRPCRLTRRTAGPHASYVAQNESAGGSERVLRGMQAGLPS